MQSLVAPIWSSDAGRWGALLIAALALALVALIADRRRVRRNHPDRVGFMPWTGLFLVSLLLAAVAGMRALELWLAPLGS